MSASKGEGHGAAKKNELVELGRFDSQGPIDVIVRNLSTTGDAVVKIEKKSDSSMLVTNKDTAVTAEGSGYVGNGVTTAFTGQSINNVPVVPGSITVNDAGGSYDLVDGGDGIMYTDDTDEDVAGTVDYFTGAIVLAYPAGKEPSGGAMTFDYYYQDSVLTKGGQKTFHVNNVQQDEELVVKAASDVEGGTELRCEMISTWE